jgi:hypothetical protein
MNNKFCEKIIVMGKEIPNDWKCPNKLLRYTINSKQEND